MAQGRIVGLTKINKVLQNGKLLRIPVTAAGSGVLYIRTKDLDFDAPNREKYVDHIIFDLQAPEDIPLFKVEVGIRNSLQEADPVVWNSMGYVTLDNPKVDLRLTARFFSLRLTDEAPVAQWNLSNIEFYGKVLGLGRL